MFGLSRKEKAIKILTTQREIIKNKQSLDQFDAFQIGQYAQRYFGDRSTHTLAASKLHDLFKTGSNSSI